MPNTPTRGGQLAKRTYETPQIRVSWNSERCIHTGKCLNALPAVFDVQRRPWVDIEGAAAPDIAEAVEKCPTGALRYERLDGVPGEPAPAVTTITPWPDGPLFVRGTVEIRDGRGDLIDEGSRMALCRCGYSRNHPFCDLSHRDADFHSAPRAPRDTAESPSDVTSEVGP
jgi:uncharacterized Fe-S cluster protein YjdI/CDGSH-type Zn-finger protein